MSKAKIFAEGSVDEIFSRADDLSEIGLDVPMISKIATNLKKRGFNLDGRLYTVEGVRDAILSYRMGARQCFQILPSVSSFRDFL